MAEKEVFQHGGVTFPLAVDTTQSSLRDADPSVFYALEFIRFALDKYVGARFMFEAQRAELHDVLSIVQSTVPWDPQEYLSTSQFRFPLLALYRKSTQLSDKTAGYRHDTTSLGLAYVLPPLTGGQLDGMLPLLNAIKGTIDHCIELGWDPTFAPSNGYAGDVPWAFAGLESIGAESASWGSMAGVDDLIFPTLLFELVVVERASIGDVPGAYSSLSGTDVNVQFQPAADGSGGPVYDELAADLVNLDLALSLVSPASGPVAGGTVITLTGVSFDVGCIVYIGGREADAIAVVSSTSITCQTPVHDALPSSVDVTVTNRRDQSATLSAAFTYV